MRINSNVFDYDATIQACGIYLRKSGYYIVTAETSTYKGNGTTKGVVDLVAVDYADRSDPILTFFHVDPYPGDDKRCLYLAMREDGPERWHDAIQYFIDHYYKAFGEPWGLHHWRFDEWRIVPNDLSGLSYIMSHDKDSIPPELKSDFDDIDISGILC